MRIRPGSIFFKGLLLISVSVVLQLCTAFVILIAQRDAERAEEWADHSKIVVESAQHTIRTALEGHSAVRAAAVFRDVNLEVPEREALRTLPAQIARLRELVADNPPQQQQLDDAARSITKYLAWLNSQETYARAGRWAEFADGLRPFVGKSLIDQVLDDLRQFLAVEQRLDARRLVAAAASRHALQRWAVIFAVLSIPVAVVVIWVYSTSVGGRVGTVTENARRMAEGLPLSSPIRGTDEIAQLDAVLHRTAQQLSDNLEAERKYAQELASRADELSRLNAELRFQTQENETFVYSASHDLRSPLVNLQGFAKEIQHGCAELRHTFAGLDLPERARARINTVLEQDIVESLRYIQTAASRLSGIIDALLRLSRAGRLEYQLDDVQLGPVVRRIVDALGATVHQRDATITIRDLPIVRADVTAVEQVFANLIGNAINYLDPQRRGLIEIGTANGSEASPDPALVTAFVRDNGLGIAADHQQKLFVALQRLHGDTVPGEGIGLALVKRIVDRLGGRVWVRSNAGEGSTFYVALPAASERPRGV